MSKNKLLLIIMLVLASDFTSTTDAAQPFISERSGDNTLLLCGAGTIPTILIDKECDPGVLRAVKNLQTDFHQVSGITPRHSEHIQQGATPAIIVGVVGTDSYIDQLARKRVFDSGELTGKREKYLIQTVSNPLPGVVEAVIVAGSDKRGAIYGIYEISRQIGVSPWYYWADVPPAKKETLYFVRGKYTDGEPAVRYRGIFLNDEAPALSGWAHATFGGFNHHFYEKVFELLLRLKANFLWPAMWGNAFYDDDPLNGKLADETGIVMGTSHHEPMAMAQQDWHRYARRNKLSPVWNYNENGEALREAWRFGMERSKTWGKVVTVGMRGDGDEAMEESTNIELLEKIIRDQRQIIEEVTGKAADETPQVWTLYKEVQDYYDHGMRVPEDVTLLLCDDNWGNIRKLPNGKAKPRKGGYGIYYHFDYVGAPRNSKWININPIQRVWEQMSLSYSHGVDRLWVVNVGDLKPMEFPIHFFLDMAWNPERFKAANLEAYTEQWCREQFGNHFPQETARLLTFYSKYNRRVTPELLDHKTYSLEHYNEFQRVVDEYRMLRSEAMGIYYFLPDLYRDAFDQLVLFPINACCNLYEMYYAVAMNHKLADKNDPAANDWADKARKCFQKDSLFTLHYNHALANGKWPHMMDQTRIGYTSWQQPGQSVMPKVFHVPENDPEGSPCFVEQDGYVSIEAGNYSRKQETDDIRWEVIPHFGKTVSGITTFPQNAYPYSIDSIWLEYDIHFTDQGECDVTLLLAPTLNFNENKGLRYAVSFNGEKEQIVNFNGHYQGELGPWQVEHIIRSVTRHTLSTPGTHTLRIHVMDPAIVVEKILINRGGLKPSYLGPPQSPVRFTENDPKASHPF